MNLESALEAFTERAAIMEYDAELNRKAATLAAFSLYFPDDYQAMKESVARKLDGGTIMYEFLEGLIASLGTALKSPTTNAKTKNVESHGKPPENPSMTQETPPIAIRKGLTALEYMTFHGIPLIAAYSSGAMIAKQEPENFTTDPREISALMAGKGDKKGRAKGTRIERFYFIPANASLLCLDIDRKNGKDGIAEFYAWAERAGKPRYLLPRVLQDLPVNFPCYTETPSGGLHLYFSYSGGKVPKKILSPETPGVEIKHGAPGLTAPGSCKNGIPYILHGELETAPLLPAFIQAELEPPKQKATAYIFANKDKRKCGKPSWDKIRDWTEKDGTGAGRNDRAFNLACHARNHGYTETETLNAMMGEPYLDGLPEIEIKTAVHSAFSRGKTA